MAECSEDTRGVLSTPVNTEASSRWWRFQKWVNCMFIFSPSQMQNWAHRVNISDQVLVSMLLVKEGGVLRNCTVLFTDLAQSSCCELEQATGHSLKHFQNGTFPKKSLAIKLKKTLSPTRESRRHSVLLWLISSVSHEIFTFAFQRMYCNSYGVESVIHYTAQTMYWSAFTHMWTWVASHS